MNYTSIKQSKKLLELGLNAESADMYYNFYRDEWGKVKSNGNIPSLKMHSLDDIPCWSVGALLDVIPNYTLVCNELGMHKCICVGLYSTNALNTLFDAIFDMVCWLIENNYIKKGK